MQRAFGFFAEDLPQPAAAIAVDAGCPNYHKAGAWGRLCRMSGMPVSKMVLAKTLRQVLDSPTYTDENEIGDRLVGLVEESNMAR